jgi:glycosyltransferase involved in cell wall biosynthesis
MSDRERVPLTAIVTSCDEAALLPRALAGISFCDELIVVEVGSTDGETAAVAERFGARFVRHSPVRIAEAVRADVAPEARHDLLLVIDPDEEVPEMLARQVVELVRDLPSDVAAVDAPLRYYFHGKRLRGTVWGGPSRRRLLVRRSAVELIPTIWGGMRLHDGYRVLVMPYSEETAIDHYWVTGWRDLVAKHLRYLAQEPGDRAAAGHLTGVREVVLTPWRSFRESYITKHGYRDGVAGLGLSIFYAGFRTASEFLLLRQLRRTRS